MSPFLGVPIKEKHSVRLKWKAVTGAAAYNVQILSTERIKKWRVKECFIIVELSHGVYEFRLASINKKGRRGPWSSWRKIEIKARKVEKKMSLEEGRKYRIDITRVSGWRLLVPGLPQLIKGRKKMGAIIMGTAIFGTLFGLYSNQQADYIAAQASTDPLYILYNEPVIYFSQRNMLTTNASTNVLFVTGFQSNSQSDADYKKHRLNANFGVIILLGAYAIHLFDIFRGTMSYSSMSARSYEFSFSTVALINRPGEREYYFIWKTHW